MRHLSIAMLLLAIPASSHAQSGREALTQALFATRDKAAALAQLGAVEAAAGAALARSPGDMDAQLTRAMALSYRAKITRNRSDGLAAKAQFDALVAKNPRNAEAQAALGAWHLSAVESLGGLMARAALGARKDAGLEASDRAVALGGERAVFPALAGMLRLAIDPTDVRGAVLVEAGAKGSTPTALDRALQRRAAQLSAVVKGGDTKLIQATARRLLPLGQLT